MDGSTKTWQYKNMAIQEHGNPVQTGRWQATLTTKGCAYETVQVVRNKDQRNAQYRYQFVVGHGNLVQIVSDVPMMPSANSRLSSLSVLKLTAAKSQKEIATQLHDYLDCKASARRSQHCGKTKSFGIIATTKNSHNTSENEDNLIINFMMMNQILSTKTIPSVKHIEANVSNYNDADKKNER